MDVRAKERPRRGNKKRKETLLTLPPELSLLILSFLDIKTLGRVAQICRRLRKLARDDVLWSHHLEKSFHVLCTSPSVSNCTTSTREAHANYDVARISHNWINGTYDGRLVVTFRQKEIPRLRVAESKLDDCQKNRNAKDSKLIFSSRDRVIETRQQSNNARVEVVFRGLETDVVDFLVGDTRVIGVSRDGTLVSWKLNDKEETFTREERYGGDGRKWKGKKKTKTVPTRYPELILENAHESDIHAVVGSDDFCITGSRDALVKMWSLGNEEVRNHEHGAQLVTAIPMGDRVWSLGFSPETSLLAVGTAGHNDVPPLILWDVETAQFVGVLGNDGDTGNTPIGAGTLHLHFETPQSLISAGYDTCLRVWDLRTRQSALELEDPNDNTVYCACSDPSSPLIAAGTARHAVVNVWDRRNAKMPLRMIYSNLCESKIIGSSPVYSLAMDWDRLYASHDTGISLLDFGKYRAVGEEVRGSFAY